MAQQSGGGQGFPLGADLMDGVGALLAALGLVGIFAGGGPAMMLPQPLGSWALLVLGGALMAVSLPRIFRHARERAEQG